VDGFELSEEPGHVGNECQRNRKDKELVYDCRYRTIEIDY